MKRWIGLVSALLALAMTASADIVHLKNGKKIEGEVISNSGGKVVVKTKFGTTELKEADIERIEERANPKEEYKKRLEAVADGDVDALMELYAWAKGEELKRESTEVLRKVIKADPDHENARRLLGYVQYDGKWMTKKAAEKAEAKAEAERMKAQGLVQYKGEWMTPEEKEVKEHEARGEILVDGEWVNKRNYEKAKKMAALKAEAEERRANGEYLVGDKWMPKTQAEKEFTNLQTPYMVHGDNVVLMTNRGIDFGDKISVTVDSAFRQAHQFFGKKPDSMLQVYFANSLEDYNRLNTDMLAADQKSSAFYAACSGWLPDNPQDIDMASATYYYQADSLADIYVTHATVEQFIHRLIGPDAADPPPRWFIDGVSSYIERWKPPQLFNWSKDRLRSVGGNLKLKTLFGSYPVTEQSILESGLIVAFLKDPNAPEELRKLFNDAVVAVNDGKKVSKAFRKLEKALISDEDVFYDWADV